MEQNTGREYDDADMGRGTDTLGTFTIQEYNRYRTKQAEGKSRIQDSSVDDPGHQILVSRLSNKGQAWRESAACLGKPNHLFFPEQEGSILPAQNVCQGCQVKNECLEYAIENREDNGVWGGVSARERQRMIRALRKINK